MTSLLAHENVLAPNPAEREELDALSVAIDHIASVEQRRNEAVAKLVGPDGTEVEIPASAFHGLQAIVNDLAHGNTVTVIPHDRELTTKEAADILHVSRQFLVRLLDRNEIPYHRAGTHRRIRVEDLLAYRERRAKIRKAKLDELTRLSEEVEGGYR